MNFPNDKELVVPLHENSKAVIKARRAASRSLVSSLGKVPANFSEQQLAIQWHNEISKNPDIVPYGWYQPPPNGISVLIGEQPSFDRLVYKSLREEQNWPSAEINFGKDSIVYPYFSVIDRSTGMIGDYVGTFYNGHDESIREWIIEAYNLIIRTAEFVEIGMTFGELFNFCRSEMRALGAANQTYSLHGGMASDIGHTIPWFSSGMENWQSFIQESQKNEVAHAIANARSFVNAESDIKISENSALTIEPQMTVPGLPMVSFHSIVLFDSEEKHLVQYFDDAFKFFGMTEWLNPPHSKFVHHI